MTEQEQVENMALEARKKTLDKVFEGCTEEAKETFCFLLEMYDNIELIKMTIQDNIIREAIQQFFVFALEVIKVELKDKCKEGNTLNIKATDKVADVIKEKINTIKPEMRKYIEHLFYKDYAKFLAVVKACSIESDFIHNMLVSQFKFISWVILGNFLLNFKTKKHAAKESLQMLINLLGNFTENREELDKALENLSNLIESLREDEQNAKA